MASEPWQISLFGGLRCRRGDVDIERFRTRKAASLLAYLCLHADRTHPREELVELFWPDLEPEAARNNLRQTLHWLRRKLETQPGDCLVIGDYDSVRLAPGFVRTDVQELEANLQ